MAVFDPCEEIRLWIQIWGTRMSRNWISFMNSTFAKGLILGWPWTTHEPQHQSPIHTLAIFRINRKHPAIRRHVNSSLCLPVPVTGHPITSVQQSKDPDVPNPEQSAFSCGVKWSVHRWDSICPEQLSYAVLSWLPVDSRPMLVVVAYLWVIKLLLLMVQLVLSHQTGTDV